MKTLFVARGRTVTTGGGSHREGEMVTLCDEEAERLSALGFLQETPPDIAPRKPPTPGGVGSRQTFVQGPDFSHAPSGG